MHPAALPTHLHLPRPTGTGTGPPRRSLLGSARQQHQEQYTNGGATNGGQQQHSTNGNASASGSGLGNGGRVTVPQKRKIGGGSARERERGGGAEKRRRGEGGERHHGDPHRQRHAGGVGERDGDENAIRCRCGSSADDGFSIACDVCARWCHAACFGVVEGEVPEEWKCWLCAPAQAGKDPPHPPLPHPALTGGGKTSRRRASVSGRRGTTGTPPAAHVELVGVGTEGELEDERTQYVQIEDDIVPLASTQRKLRAYAAHWRGVSALSPPTPAPLLSYGEGEAPQHTPLVFGAPPAAHPTALRPLPPPSTSSSLGVRPPTYTLHALAPAPPRALLAPLPTLITPSSSYLKAPANGYAHAGVPRRFVHLVGPPLGVALDGRGVGATGEGGGGGGRWVRRGCWPNAEVRAWVCGGAGHGAGGESKPSRAGRDVDREEEGQSGGKEDAEDEPRTRFGIFATRALRAGEEVVVGWEWDDGNAVHRV
ncbi:hypothetical protein DFH09DRAFT_978608, partial [Mycena vulgaris]